MHASSCSSGTAAEMAARERSNPKHALLELGILLLEISQEETFESYTGTVNLSANNTYGLCHEAARRWLDDTVGDMTPAYWEATSKCLECAFTRSSSLPDWEDGEFQKSICDSVIRPLWENCSYGNKARTQ